MIFLIILTSSLSKGRNGSTFKYFSFLSGQTQNLVLSKNINNKISMDLIPSFYDGVSRED